MLFRKADGSRAKPAPNDPFHVGQRVLFKGVLAAEVIGLEWLHGERQYVVQSETRTDMVPVDASIGLLKRCEQAREAPKALAGPPSESAPPRLKRFPVEQMVRFQIGREVVFEGPARSGTWLGFPEERLAFAESAASTLREPTWTIESAAGDMLQVLPDGTAGVADGDESMGRVGPDGSVVEIYLDESGVAVGIRSRERQLAEA